MIKSRSSQFWWRCASVPFIVLFSPAIAAVAIIFLLMMALQKMITAWSPEDF